LLSINSKPRFSSSVPLFPPLLRNFPSTFLTPYLAQALLHLNCLRFELSWANFLLFYILST
jgi:hypothetical protein